MRRKLIIILLVILSVGCSSPPGTPTATTTPDVSNTRAPTSTYMATMRARWTATVQSVTQAYVHSLTPTPIPLPLLPGGTPISNMTPPAPLSAQGPVLVFSVYDESYRSSLWAVNQDGTGLRRLMDETFERLAISPTSTLADGITVAYVTRESDDWPPTDLTLKIVRLPDGTPQTITSLLGTMPDTTLLQEALSLAWSHDGKKLAFVGGMDGETADVYSYSIDTGQILRLSEGPELLSMYVEWSPDDKYVKYEAHSQIFEHHCCGPVWVVPPDGSRSMRLIGEDHIVWDHFAGWVGDHTIAVNESSLTVVDVATGDVTSLYDGDARVTYDPQDDVWLITPFIAGCEGPQDWFLKSPTGELKTVTVTGCDATDWLDSARVFVNHRDGGQLVLISPDGEVSEHTVPVTEPTVPIVSDDGQYWAWPNACCVYGPTGLWISTGVTNFKELVSEEHHVWDLTWVPGENTLFFMAGDSLYMASAPDFDLVLISPPGMIISEYLFDATWIP